MRKIHFSPRRDGFVGPQREYPVYGESCAVMVNFDDQVIGMPRPLSFSRKLKGNQDTEMSARVSCVHLLLVV